MRKMAKFIASGVTEKGSVKHHCSGTFPELPHLSAVAAAALINASRMNFGNYQKHIDRLYTYLIKNQKPEGSFFFSKHDMVYVKEPIQWGFLTDRTAYPRPLSYILQHFLVGIKAQVKLEIEH
jgi:squalene cyclase